MSERRKANVYQATYFITIPIVGWVDVFIREEYSEIIIDNLIFCQKNKDLEVFSYVIMSSHLHLVCRRNKGYLSDLLRDFKSYTAKILLDNILSNPKESRKDWMKIVFEYHGKTQKMNTHYSFWQKTSFPIQITTNNLMQRAINYIHQNPVKSAIVTDASAYNYSSANPLSRLKVDVY